MACMLMIQSNTSLPTLSFLHRDLVQRGISFGCILILIIPHAWLFLVQLEALQCCVSRMLTSEEPLDNEAQVQVREYVFLCVSAHVTY